MAVKRLCRLFDHALSVGRCLTWLAIGVMVLALATGADGFQGRACQFREDFGTEPLYDCYMNYSYYIPCPTYSWFWMVSHLERNDIIGEYFDIGDPSMMRSTCNPGYTGCDPLCDYTIQQFRVLDFAGYGTLYPGLFSVRFDVWCADDCGCPIALPLWTSGSVEMCSGGWNYISISPPLTVASCWADYPNGYPRVLITAEHVGSEAQYPNWGFDNISTPLGEGCTMHEYGCCPALYPRPQVSHYTTMHSGYYGVDFSLCPPEWFPDFDDTVNMAYGYLELAWRIYLIRGEPSSGVPTPETTPATWGSIKSLYR